jgi:hypothetical protein
MGTPYIIVFGEDADECDSIARTIAGALGINHRTDDRISVIRSTDTDPASVVITGRWTSYS